MHINNSSELTITPSEFRQFQQLIYELAGISMSDAKQVLVQGRLAKRVKTYQFRSFKQYYDLIARDRKELQIAIDLLTTNETYFFRESKHIEYLQRSVVPKERLGRPFRVWSAASSSGEEPYTIAMVLSEHFGTSPWEVLGSDLSTRVLEKAMRGSYPIDRANNIPQKYLKAYCMKGVGAKDGTFLICPEVRKNTNFTQINLIEALPDLGLFDVIFLRNVMIYFDMQTKTEVVRRIVKHLRPGGYFFVGHSESLHGMDITLKTVSPSVYRKEL